MEGGEGEGGEAAACPPRGAASGERSRRARRGAQGCGGGIVRLPRHGGTIARMLEPPNTARPMLRRADVRRDSRFGGLAARFRRIADSPCRRFDTSRPTRT
ncbi:hypothetical protein AQ925_00255 [Burkholderia pseudomallei]|nr:hypothetical protein AQ925_00255 [Burkholderia pseudomallei]OND03999.1 hypothetical protein AQ926_03845 [Burkholderia pseudomallei]OND14326.1 hypothetical protein AQ927_14720 [Burkholderia pseudomallei]OND17142.1 hypothetical protein AQ929_29290 [Burkholderia pseudomallei]OND20515.1 hypothetical protein AQ928_16420 [Burkholderia pseudomallei]